MHSTINRIALFEAQLHEVELDAAVRLVVGTRSFRRRRASIRNLTPGVVSALAHGFIASDPHVAGIGNLVKKVTKLIDLFKKAPKLLTSMKEFLGDLEPRNLLKWAKDGLRSAGKKISKSLQDWPLAMFFYPKSKLPTLSDMLAEIIKGTKIGAALKKVQAMTIKVDDWLEKHPIVKGLSRPILAAVFIYVWINVSEISWDTKSIFEGFTGQMPFSEVVGSLPESAIGLLFAGMGIGYGFMGPVLMARITWLVASNYVEYVPGKGFKVYWDLMGRFTPESGTVLDRTPDVQFIKWSI